MTDTFNFTLKAVDDDGNVKEDGSFSDGATKENAITVSGTDVTAYIKEPGSGQGFGFYLKGDYWEPWTRVCATHRWIVSVGGATYSNWADGIVSDTVATWVPCDTNCGILGNCIDINNGLVCDTLDPHQSAAISFYLTDIDSSEGIIKVSIHDNSIEGEFPPGLSPTVDEYNDTYIGMIVTDSTGNDANFMFQQHPNGDGSMPASRYHFVGVGDPVIIDTSQYMGDDGHNLNGSIKSIDFGTHINYYGATCRFKYTCDYIDITA